MKSIKITNKWGAWFWVLPEFLNKCPKYKKYSQLSLIMDHQILDYLHNEEGPAVDNNRFPYVTSHWINGIPLTIKEWEVREWHNKLQKILLGEDDEI